MGLFGNNKTNGYEKAIKIYQGKLAELELQLKELYMEQYLQKSGFYDATALLYEKHYIEKVTPELQKTIAIIKDCSRNIEYMKENDISRWNSAALEKYRTDEISEKEKEIEEMKNFIKSLGDVQSTPATPAVSEKPQKKSKKKEVKNDVK